MENNVSQIRWSFNCIISDQIALLRSVRASSFPTVLKI
ncbi:hypothetical protein SAMN05444162_3504 [Paenibacillaceae bacterium GAS479]|nr:hypothetical protein SAMN05444162_3504 [Paenibacillaceae bacterium GAS479]